MFKINNKDTKTTLSPERNPNLRKDCQLLQGSSTYSICFRDLVH